MSRDSEQAALWEGAPEAVLDAVLKVLPQPCQVLDAEGRFLAVLGQDGAWDAASGGLVGRGLADLLPPAPAQAFLEQIRLALDTGQVQTHVFSLSLPAPGAANAPDPGAPPKEHIPAWFEARLAPLPGGHGGTPAVLCLALDMTELTKALLIQEEQRMRLEEITIKDELTGLMNRRRLLAVAEHEVERARRYAPKPLSLLLVDLDEFKEFNDKRGHGMGDMALAALGRAIEHCCRANDIVARWGGEEFVVLLPETGINGARLVGEKIRCLVEGLCLGDGAPLGLTASVGVAALRQGEDNLEPLMSRADKALYRARASGMNKVCVFATGAEAEP